MNKAFKLTGVTPRVIVPEKIAPEKIAEDEILEAIFDPSNRANPYPLFDKLRERPVSWQKGGMSQTGSYVVSTYKDVVALLHDIRLSSDMRKSKDKLITGDIQFSSFINFDPPEHDCLRRIAMRHFGPPDRPEYVEQLRPRIEQITCELIDVLKNQLENHSIGDWTGGTRRKVEKRFDLVKTIAGPLPVLMIATILGVPEEDRMQFKTWSNMLIDNSSINTPAAQAKVLVARKNLVEYMTSLVQLCRRNPKDDLISRMATQDQMEEPDLIATATLLLIAGHETTVNLIANGMLTLLRFPRVLDRIRQEPDLIIGAVEEVLRYEPPVQLLSRRTALEDIFIGGVTIPKGSLVTLALAAANRDPARFSDPDQFNPDRRSNVHLGFGSGIHYCFGAPLARIEAQVVLHELARRLKNPRLGIDPPPFRRSPILRGPQELLIEVDDVIDYSHTR